MTVWVPWLLLNLRILVLIKHLVAVVAHQSVILLNHLFLKIICIKMLILIAYSMKFPLPHPFLQVKDIQILCSNAPRIRMYLYLTQVKKKVLFIFHHFKFINAMQIMVFYNIFLSLLEMKYIVELFFSKSLSIFTWYGIIL